MVPTLCLSGYVGSHLDIEGKAQSFRGTLIRAVAPPDQKQPVQVVTRRHPSQVTAGLLIGEVLRVFPTSRMAMGETQDLLKILYLYNDLGSHLMS